MKNRGIFVVLNKLAFGQKIKDKPLFELEV